MMNSRDLLHYIDQMIADVRDEKIKEMLIVAKAIAIRELVEVNDLNRNSSWLNSVICDLSIRGGTRPELRVV